MGKRHPNKIYYAHRLKRNRLSKAARRRHFLRRQRDGLGLPEELTEIHEGTIIENNLEEDMKSIEATDLILSQIKTEIQEEESTIHYKNFESVDIKSYPAIRDADETNIKIEPSEIEIKSEFGSDDEQIDNFGVDVSETSQAEFKEGSSKLKEEMNSDSSNN